jgi:arylsulfatase A-like enzyme
MLFSADRAIADIAAALVTAGKTNTVIIVTSDHGYFHGEGIDPAGKTAPYLPAMRIPLIVSGPSAFVSQDKVCSALVGNVDIAPTIYALSGASSTRTMDGVSLAPLLTTPTGPELRTHLMLEWQGAVGGGGVTGWNTEITEYHSILSKQYLYTLYSDAEQELYDLTADPFQLVNQIGVTAYAAVQSDLASRLSGAVNCTGSGCVL